MGKRLSAVVQILFLVVLAGIALGICYLLYVTLQYHRLPELTDSEITGSPSSQIIMVDTDYTVRSWNIASALLPANRATWREGSDRGKTTKDQVSTLLGKQIRYLQQGADFTLLQEVDQKAHRSQGVRERSLIVQSSTDCMAVWAENLHTARLLWPLSNPTGSAVSGLLTLSRHPIESAQRISLPTTTDFPRSFFALDCAASVTQIPVENGKTLYLINTQFEGGSDKKAQLEKLGKFMAAIQADGDYAIAGGDFSMVPSGISFPSTEARPGWAMAFDESLLPEGIRLVRSRNEDEVPTTRSAAEPYKEGRTFVSTVDGFLVTKGVHASSIIEQTDFAYSDHQPVTLTFSLE